MKYGIAINVYEEMSNTLTRNQRKRIQRVSSGSEDAISVYERQYVKYFKM